MYKKPKWEDSLNLAHMFLDGPRRLEGTPVRHWVWSGRLSPVDQLGVQGLAL